MNVMKIEGFVGYVALCENTTVAFSWGYLINKNNDNERFIAIDEALANKGYECGYFYSAETGVLPEYQMKGIGTALATAKINDAALLSNVMVFTTINKNMMSIYKKLFAERMGELQVSPGAVTDYQNRKFFSIVLRD